MKIRKVLVANRSEIAIRVIRACQEMDIGVVAVYSKADRNNLFYRLADESVQLKGNSLQKTYLDGKKMIDAARKTGCDAIHPGYGFLSENPGFVKMCEDDGVIFIGPSSSTMETVGNKARVKEIMKDAGVPVLPSIESGDVAEIAEFGRKTGYPLIVKPAYGGGGKGMKTVDSEDELEGAVKSAAGIGKAAFGEAALYVEKCLVSPRHIEVQILADTKGKIVDLAERECSVQRRHQKLIEESPSPAIGPGRRRHVARLARKAAEAVGYTNAGTIEFLYDGEKFYFLEVNARVQVEHTVTELVSGVDIVKEQIRIASGLPLSVDETSRQPRGWAIQCRINAEDPYKNFLPSPGKIWGYRSPGGFGVRVDSGVFMKCEIPAEYDSLVSKLTVWGRDRDEAIARMRRALGEYVIIGIPTTKPLYRAIFREKNFISGNYDTGYLEKNSRSLSNIMRELRKSKKRRDESIMSIFRDNLPVCDANVAYGDFDFQS